MTPEEKIVGVVLAQFGVDPSPARVSAFIGDINNCQAMMLADGSQVRFAAVPGGTQPAKSQRFSAADDLRAAIAQLPVIPENRPGKRPAPTMPPDSRKMRRQATHVPVDNAGATLTDEQREWNDRVAANSKRGRREREDAENGDLL